MVGVPDPVAMVEMQYEVVPFRGRMTEAEYDAERAKIAPDKTTAGIRWEQELASLFHRSGWIVEELAKRENKGKSWISQRLIFGRFLAVARNSTVVEKLSERRFRDYWDRTADLKHERPRFAEILKLMQAEMTLGRSTIPKGYPNGCVLYRVPVPVGLRCNSERDAA